MSTQEVALLSPDQLYRMSSKQQNDYFASLKPDQAAMEKQKLQAFKQHINGMNLTYLEQAVDRYATCPPTGGGQSATYAPGTTLNFNFPTAGGAYLRELEVTVDIKFTPATGTSATYAWSAAGAWAWFSTIEILYNGQLHRIRPYHLKVWDTIRFKQWLANEQVLSGLNADSGTTSNIAQAQPALTGGTPAVSKFKFRIPLQLHRRSPVGMLPMQGQGTKGQINFICASTLGASNCDPMQVPINYSGGSGNAITLDSTEKTITVNAIYNDGTNYASKNPLALHLEKLPASQHIIDQQLTPLTAGNILRQRISTQQPHYLVTSVVIDGNSSTVFCATSNLAVIELDQDAAGQNKFWQFGSANNTNLYDYYSRMRRIYGQDLDPGVILWVNATQFNTVDNDNSDGNQVLDMSSGKWTDVNIGLQVSSVSTSNFTPRVETYLFSRNDAGLIID